MGGCTIRLEESCNVRTISSIDMFIVNPRSAIMFLPISFISWREHLGLQAQQGALGSFTIISMKSNLLPFQVLFWHVLRSANEVVDGLARQGSFSAAVRVLVSLFHCSSVVLS